MILKDQDVSLQIKANALQMFENQSCFTEVLDAYAAGDALEKMTCSLRSRISTAEARPMDLAESSKMHRLYHVLQVLRETQHPDTCEPCLPPQARN